MWCHFKICYKGTGYTKEVLKCPVCQGVCNAMVKSAHNFCDLVDICLYFSGGNLEYLGFWCNIKLILCCSVVQTGVLHSAHQLKALSLCICTCICICICDCIYLFWKWKVWCYVVQTGVVHTGAHQLRPQPVSVASVEGRMASGLCATNLGPPECDVRHWSQYRPTWASASWHRSSCDQGAVTGGMCGLEQQTNEESRSRKVVSNISHTSVSLKQLTTPQVRVSKKKK